MNTKHIIDVKGLEEFVFGEDRNLWKRPYTKNRRNYGWRRMKLQHGNRWILNGVPWSKRQLTGKLIKDPNPIEIYPDDIDCPFRLKHPNYSI